MTTWNKYLLFQVPGWILVALILIAMRYWFGLPVWIALFGFVLWVIKDFLFYPLLRVAYQSGPKTGVDQLIGLRGVVRQNLDPRGQVYLRGELWRAETAPGVLPIVSGSRVRVLRAEGMTLIVMADTDYGSRNMASHGSSTSP